MSGKHAITAPTTAADQAGTGTQDTASQPRQERPARSFDEQVIEIERLELDPTKRGRQYSKGNRQKVALVAALASDAELLILDEPTSGLDPLMEDVFQQLVREAVERGASVLLSSHIMSEVENLADRVSVIRSGRIIYDATMPELHTTLSGIGQDLEEFFLSLYSRDTASTTASTTTSEER